MIICIFCGALQPSGRPSINGIVEPARHIIVQLDLGTLVEVSLYRIDKQRCLVMRAEHLQLKLRFHHTSICCHKLLSFVVCAREFVHELCTGRMKPTSAANALRNGEMSVMVATMHQGCESESDFFIRLRMSN